MSRASQRPLLACAVIASMTVAFLSAPSFVGARVSVGAPTRIPRQVQDELFPITPSSYYEKSSKSYIEL
eukprot:CAMPEP_0168450256 /NCGR_PEP_ID=MMETSP0228-20121227/48020_1 /TAXON_ID=133427 /ORGANISM="Protoceratium reticulatum, Strain CCCM 535 (=CCMP 1889)" /LENGTH=68 /DNA_ID=CAMNT_0008464823 /DNA_START=77 /DNA_END=279 /DNA_ORIENTATION=-